MDVEKKLELALSYPVQECVTHDELRALFEAKQKPRHYIGFEVSGALHVPAVFTCGKVIQNLQKAGVETTVLLADWHAVMNNKLGGDWDKISKAAAYFEEAFKFHCPGVKIVRGSELYHNNDEYWKKVVEFSAKVTVARVTRCVGIMGRSESEKLSAAQYLYPPMQAVDIHELGSDIAHAGMDQRKVHMLAREVFPEMKWKKPIALHHHLQPGLGEPVQAGEDKLEQVAAAKMSKSKPDSALLIHDSEEEIKRKIAKAFCPQFGENNPVLELSRLCFSYSDVIKEIQVNRPEKYGGNVSFASYAELETAYSTGKLHAMDLKNGVASALNELISPIRKHFEKKKSLLEAFQ